MSNLQRILNEAMDAASRFIPEKERGNFYVVGGAALARYGSTRKTDDVDFAVTPQTLYQFIEAAEKDHRFQKHPDDSWTYTCEGEDIAETEVRLEFLAAGSEFAPAKLHGGQVFPGALLASLADIAVMKANAYNSRNEDHDLEDMKFALNKMVEKKETFAVYKFKEEELETIKEVAAHHRLEELLEKAIGGELGK